MMLVVEYGWYEVNQRKLFAKYKSNSLLPFQNGRFETKNPVAF